MSVLEVASRLKNALDVERTTKKFYTEFQTQHLEFVSLIEGIPDERERRWYASVLLNRLMFVYFLQRKGFVDGGSLAEHLGTYRTPGALAGLSAQGRTSLGGDLELKRDLSRTAVKKVADALGIPFEENPRLVRGLDYYTRTAFEVLSSDLGAQSALLGGGRYDGLIESLGGQPTPGVGWAAGVERLAMLVGEQGEEAADVIVVVEDDQLIAHGIAAAGKLRAAGLSTDLLASGSPRKRFDKAVKSGAGAIVALALRDGAAVQRVKAEGDLLARVEAVLA